MKFKTILSALLSFGTFTFVGHAQAIPPRDAPTSAQLVSIEETSGGNMDYTFTIGSRTVELSEEDGAGTLAVLTAVIYQKPIEQLQLNQMSFDSFNKMQIPDWEILKVSLVKALKKLEQVYSEAAGFSNEHAKSYSDLKKAIQLISSSSSITFGAYNDTVGLWISKNAHNHHYNDQPLVEVDYNPSANPVGMLLKEKTLHLTSDLIISRSALPITFAPGHELKDLLSKLNKADKKVSSFVPFKLLKDSKTGDIIYIERNTSSESNEVHIFRGDSKNLKPVLYSRIDTFRDGGSLLISLLNGSQIYLPANLFKIEKAYFQGADKVQIFYDETELTESAVKAVRHSIAESSNQCIDAFKVK